MTIDLRPGVLSDVVGHLDELRDGLEELTICVDAHKAQLTRCVTAQIGAEGSPSLRVSGKGSEGILHLLATLLDIGIPLSVTYQDDSGNTVGRSIVSVQEDSNTVFLSREQLEVY